MINKNISINGLDFDFIFYEHLNMWRIIESPNFITGYKIDIEIDLKYFTNGLDWDEITRFIQLLKDKMSLFTEGISESKRVLKCFFKSIYNNAYDNEFFHLIDFNLTGIDFRGNCTIKNLEQSFDFHFFFFPKYLKDPYKDIGAFTWRAIFRDTLLLGVYCDRI